MKNHRRTTLLIISDSDELNAPFCSDDFGRREDTTCQMFASANLEAAAFAASNRLDMQLRATPLVDIDKVATSLGLFYSKTIAAWQMRDNKQPEWKQTIETQIPWALSRMKGRGISVRWIGLCRLNDIFTVFGVRRSPEKKYRDHNQPVTHFSIAGIRRQRKRGEAKQNVDVFPSSNPH